MVSGSQAATSRFVTSTKAALARSTWTVALAAPTAWLSKSRPRTRARGLPRPACARERRTDCPTRNLCRKSPPPNQPQAVPEARSPRASHSPRASRSCDSTAEAHELPWSKARRSGAGQSSGTSGASPPSNLAAGESSAESASSAARNAASARDEPPPSARTRATDAGLSASIRSRAAAALSGCQQLWGTPTAAERPSPIPGWFCGTARSSQMPLVCRKAEKRALRIAGRRQPSVRGSGEARGGRRFARRRTDPK
eukprot:scaffold18099_cov112-Isochrysis_galbana.AAC.8